MTLKGWVLGKVNGTVKRGSTAEATRVAPSLGSTAAADRDAREPHLREIGERRDGERAGTTHLGRYEALVAAIREELEQFVTNELRLHLAIAERDRYLLTSIEVECTESEQHRELLRRFIAEFKPEQIKHYLARDVIGGLRNASAIDLTQFAGLNAAHEEHAAAEPDPYDALLAQLQSAGPDATVRPYAVTLVGRWSDHSAAQRPAAAHAQRNEPRDAASPHTPLAGRPLTLELEDAEGTRRIELDAVVPGRRYSIGKDESCDVVVDGVYASRRHCELWYDKGTWWVIDAGSTNGIRVECNGSVRRHAPAQGDHDHLPIELPSGASLVLSAHADGTPAQYPRISLPATSQADARTPDAAALVTPIAPARHPRATLTVTAHMASGTREAEIIDRALPFRIGRSRNQALVIDWSHADVSGRHVEIVAIDPAGASVVVHGENGVTVAGTTYEPGAQFHWKPGEQMLLGRRADGRTPLCALTLSRAR